MSKVTMTCSGCGSEYELTKYEISYTNSYYRYLHSDKTIGQGKQAFLELIKKEMTGEPEPLITIIEEE